MRTKILFVSLLVFGCLSVYGGVYVKGNLHFEPFYDSGVQQPAEDAAVEWWFEKDRVSFVTTRWRFTLDRKKNQLVAVNLDEKFYVPVPMPMNLSSHVDQQLFDNLKQYQIVGMVKRTGGTGVFLGKKCREYSVSESITFQGGRFYDRERVLLASEDVPFDLELLEELYAWIRSFFKPSDAYRKELEEVAGFMMTCDDVRFQEGAEVKYNFKVLEISEKAVPASVFGVPGDFKKKETFTRPELIDIRTTYYFYYR